VAKRLGIDVEARKRRRPDGELLTWRAAGLKHALEDATLPFFMQWDHDEQYPGRMPAKHRNGARGVTSLSLRPRDAERFARWIDGADVPVELFEAGLWNVTVETDRGALVIGGESNG
jgi:hypothetical protein